MYGLSDTVPVFVLDCDAQDAFNSLVEYTSSIKEVVSLLLELGTDIDKVKGAVYGWALSEAGID